jgi:hypothetical protein
MDKFFVPSSALEEAQRAIVSKFHVGPALDISDIFRLGLGYYEEEILYPCEASLQSSSGEWYTCKYDRIATRHVHTLLWHLLPFLCEQASYAGLYISEHTDWSQWVAYYDHRRMGTWLYMPEMPETRLEAIEIFEAFGEFPT